MKIDYEFHDHCYGSGRDKKGRYFCLPECRACATEAHGREAVERFSQLVSDPEGETCVGVKCGSRR